MMSTVAHGEFDDATASAGAASCAAAPAPTTTLAASEHANARPTRPATDDALRPDIDTPIYFRQHVLPGRPRAPPVPARTRAPPAVRRRDPRNSLLNYSSMPSARTTDSSYTLLDQMV